MTEIFDAIRAFNRFYTDHLGVLSEDYLHSPYTLTEARVLYEIGARETCTAADLAGDLRLDQAHLSRILKRFQGEGLVQAKRDGRDRRSKSLHMTKQGADQREILAQRSREKIAAAIGEMPEPDQRALVAAMEEVRRRLEAGPADVPSILLRDLQPGDIGWVVESQARFYTSAFGWNDQFEALVASVAGQFLKNFDPACEKAWIAEAAGQRVGSIFIANGGEGIAKLRLLYVDPAARGTGLGKRLVHEAIAFATQSGYGRLSLWTNDNLDAARAIYLKAGFRLTHEEVHTLFGPELNGQTWELDLRETAAAGA